MTNFTRVSFDAARMMFEYGYMIHYEATNFKGKTRGSSALKARGDNFVNDVRRCLNESFRDFRAKTVIFKVSAEEIQPLHFEEETSKPQQWDNSPNLYRFVFLYMKKGGVKRFVCRYPIIDDKIDPRFMEASSAKYKADQAKNELCLSLGKYFQLSGPQSIKDPLSMIEYANQFGYVFDLSNTGVVFSEDNTYWEFNGSCTNHSLTFSYRIYDVKLAGEVARAIRSNSIPVPSRMLA